jgi:hypothetical protein
MKSFWLGSSTHTGDIANHSEESLRIRLLQSFAENDPEVNKSTTMHQLNQRHFFPIHSHRCTHVSLPVHAPKLS